MKGGRKPAWMAGFDSRLCRKHGPGDEEVAAGGAPGGVAVCLCFPPLREIRRGVLQCAFRRSASPHFSRGGKLKAHLARRRENEDAWLFEIVHRKTTARFPGAMQHAALSRRDASRDTGIAQNTSTVMAGLVPAIHVLLSAGARKTWMRGSSPRMTREMCSLRPRLCSAPGREGRPAALRPGNGFNYPP